MHMRESFKNWECGAKFGLNVLHDFHDVCLVHKEEVIEDGDNLVNCDIDVKEVKFVKSCDIHEKVKLFILGFIPGFYLETCIVL